MLCLVKGLVVELWTKSYCPIRFHDFSKCGFFLTTCLLLMIIIDIPSVLEVLSVVLEVERETLLLIIMYRMPGSLGTFIDDFILLINELPT